MIEKKKEEKCQLLIKRNGFLKMYFYAVMALSIIFHFTPWQLIMLLVQKEMDSIHDTSSLMTSANKLLSAPIHFRNPRLCGGDHIRGEALHQYSAFRLILWQGFT
jgi:hypothetical protein